MQRWKSCERAREDAEAGDEAVAKADFLGAVEPALGIVEHK